MAHALEHHEVRIEETGECFVCRESETALNALARSGRKGIPLGCRGGGCGICKVEVLAGSFQKRPMSRSHVSEDDEAHNRVLACCIVPQTDIQLRVIGKIQRAMTRTR
jgi:ferredoxin